MEAASQELQETKRCFHFSLLQCSYRAAMNSPHINNYIQFWELGYKSVTGLVQVHATVLFVWLAAKWKQYNVHVVDA